MARRSLDPVYVPMSVTVPAGRAEGAALVYPIVLPVGWIDTVDVLIPPGHVGQTGLRFTLSGQQVLPWSNGTTWIVGDDVERTFSLNIETSALFNAVAFNTGFFQHVFYLRFAVRQITAATGPAPAVQLLDNAAFN